MLILVVKNESPVCIAPFFADQGMVFFTGSGGSDYLDFIGNPGDANLLEELLSLVSEHISDFSGFLFYHIPEDSPTLDLLTEISGTGKWYGCEHEMHVSPRLEMKLYPDRFDQALRKKSLVRHESWWRRNGDLRIDHLTKREDIHPLLESFFAQHTERWAATEFPGLFNQKTEQEFYRRLTDRISAPGWLRFTVVRWNEKPIAFHFGFYYNRSFFWYKPSFDILLAERSPGEVLIRQLLLRALEEGAEIFDFGLGDETFKRRFSTRDMIVGNRGIYPLKKM